jgi:hypothetical protein
MPEKIELLEQRITDLEERLEALETRPSLPTPPTPEKMMETELKELEKDPESRIKAKVERGLSRAKAEEVVSKRREFLRSELGLGKAARKAAAMLIILFVLAAAFIMPAQADQQGQAQQFVQNTNFPLVIAGGGSVASNFLSPIGVANYGLTNYVPIHRGAGLAVDWLFNASPGFAGSNVALVVAPTVDGINPDSFQRWPIIGQPFGPTNVHILTNFSAAQLTSYKGLFVMGESNLDLGTITNGGTFATTNSGAAGYTTNVPVANWSVPQGGP